MADADVVEAQVVPKKSDLAVRAGSAAVMLVLAAASWWLGGLWLDLFIGVVALATFGEFVRLILKATQNNAIRAASVLAGAAYIAAGAWALIAFDSVFVLLPVVAVIFVDTFAYGFGRTFGGPKLIPAISPNKTWAGLVGGIVGATIWFWLFYLTIYVWAAPARMEWSDVLTYSPAVKIHVAGVVVAVAAQAGDFFESWLKRRARVKDSSNLIPGHGGVFDRTDGLLPVAILMGAMLAFG